jgi:hypothetical protein
VRGGEALPTPTFEHSFRHQTKHLIGTTALTSSIDPGEGGTLGRGEGAARDMTEPSISRLSCLVLFQASNDAAAANEVHEGIRVVERDQSFSSLHTASCF